MIRNIRTWRFYASHWNSFFAILPRFTNVSYPWENLCNSVQFSVQEVPVEEWVWRVDRPSRPSVEIQRAYGSSWARVRGGTARFLLSSLTGTGVRESSTIACFFTTERKPRLINSLTVRNISLIRLSTKLAHDSQFRVGVSQSCQFQNFTSISV